MKLPYRISERSISVVVNNRMRIIHPTSPNFDALAKALRKSVHDVDLITQLADVVTFVARATFGAVQIGDDAVRWNGTKIHNAIADRLIGMLKTGDDLEPLSRFLARVMTNPSTVAQEELYLWLEAGDAPITPDGFFLAFKAVRADYKDKYSGTMDNSVGKIVQMNRKDVDPNRRNECSRGLHFCQYGYLSSFMQGGDKLMILKIDPADVVAIPQDYKNQKGRTWRYEVIGEIPPEEAETIWRGTYVSNGPERPVEVSTADEDDEDQDDATNDNGLPDYTTLRPDPLAGLDHTFGTASALTEAVQGAQLSKPTPRAKTADKAIVESRDGNQQSAAASANVVFSGAGKTFTKAEIEAAVKGSSVRGAARALGVAKSTLQGWLRKITG